MVTSSIHNFKKHCLDIYEYFAERYDEKKAKEFAMYYFKTYKPFRRSYLYYKTAWSLYDDLKLVERSGIRWYAFLGAGGVGKTTLAKNVLHFLDNSFNESRVHTSFPNLLKCIRKYPRDCLKGFLLDEPENPHTMSKEGKHVSKILGQSRQQKIFLGFCATKMGDLPSFVYKMLTGIFFVSKHGEAFFFKDRPNEYIYMLEDIKSGYQKFGWKIFFQYAKKTGCIRMTTSPFVAQKPEEQKIYEQNKWNDYINNIDSYLQSTKEEKKEKVPPREIKKPIIDRMKEKGMSDREIAEYMGVSRSRVTQIRLGLKV